MDRTIEMAVEFVRNGRTFKVSMWVNESTYWLLSKRAAAEGSDRAWLEEFSRVLGVAEAHNGKIVVP